MRHALFVLLMLLASPAIAAVNKVMVLHSGRIAEFGDKSEVLSKATKPKASPVKEIAL